MPRKQLNIGLTPAQYEAVRIAGRGRGPDHHGLLPRRHHGEGSAGSGAARRGRTAGLAAPRPAIPHQGQDTPRYAEGVAGCLASLPCSYVGLN